MGLLPPSHPKPLLPSEGSARVLAHAPESNRPPLVADRWGRDLVWGGLVWPEPRLDGIGDPLLDPHSGAQPGQPGDRWRISQPARPSPLGPPLARRAGQYPGAEQSSEFVTSNPSTRTDGPLRPRTAPLSRWRPWR